MESSLWIFITGVLVLVLLWRWQQWQRLMGLLRSMAESVDRRQSFLLEQEQSPFLRNKDLQALKHSIDKLITSYAQNRRRRAGNKQLIETMLERLEEAIFIINGDNRIALLNKAAERLFAKGALSLKNHRIDLLHSTKILECLKKVREGHKFSQEAVKVRQASQTYWFQISAAPFSATDRDPNRVFMVLYDITRLKKLEEVRNEFVANVSHELRTPLTVIRGAVDTLMDDADSINPEDSRGFLQRIQKNVMRLHHLVEDLLLLSRLELEPQPFIQKELTSLKTLIAEVVDHYHSRYGAAALPVDTDLDAEAVEFPLDPLRISQVFENLLTNAQRYAKGATGIVIRVKVAGDYVHCSVEDDGCGIPTEALPYIFERLYRVDKDRSRESGGTGLGLSIVKHIVRQHGGSVEPHSKLGVGTRIEFTLPRSLAAVPAASQ